MRGGTQSCQVRFPTMFQCVPVGLCRVRQRCLPAANLVHNGSGYLQFTCAVRSWAAVTLFRLGAAVGRNMQIQGWQVTGTGKEVAWIWEPAFLWLVGNQPDLL